MQPSDTCPPTPVCFTKNRVELVPWSMAATSGPSMIRFEEAAMVPFMGSLCSLCTGADRETDSPEDQPKTRRLLRRATLASFTSGPIMMTQCSRSASLLWFQWHSIKCQLLICIWDKFWRKGCFVLFEWHKYERDIFVVFCWIYSLLMDLVAFIIANGPRRNLALQNSELNLDTTLWNMWKTPKLEGLWTELRFPGIFSFPTLRKRLQVTVARFSVRIWEIRIVKIKYITLVVICPNIVNLRWETKLKTRIPTFGVAPEPPEGNSEILTARLYVTKHRKCC